MNEIDKLTNEYCQNKDQIESLTKANELLYLKIMELMHGIKTGTIIRCTDSGKIYRIGTIKPARSWKPFSEKPWVYGFQRNKNGNFSTRSTCICVQWEVVKDDGKNTD